MLLSTEVSLADILSKYAPGALYFTLLSHLHSPVTLGSGPRYNALVRHSFIPRVSHFVEEDDRG